MSHLHSEGARRRRLERAIVRGFIQPGDWKYNQPRVGHFGRNRAEHARWFISPLAHIAGKDDPWLKSDPWSNTRAAATASASWPVNPWKHYRPTAAQQPCRCAHCAEWERIVEAMKETILHLRVALAHVYASSATDVESQKKLFTSSASDVEAQLSNSAVHVEAKMNANSASNVEILIANSARATEALSSNDGESQIDNSASDVEALKDTNFVSNVETLITNSASAVETRSPIVEEAQILNPAGSVEARMKSITSSADDKLALITAVAANESRKDDTPTMEGDFITAASPLSGEVASVELLKESTSTMERELMTPASPVSGDIANLLLDVLAVPVADASIESWKEDTSTLSKVMPAALPISGDVTSFVSRKEDTSSMEGQLMISASPVSGDMAKHIALGATPLATSPATASSACAAQTSSDMASIIIDTVDMRFRDHEASFFAKIEALQLRLATAASEQQHFTDASAQ